MKYLNLLILLFIFSLTSKAQLGFTCFDLAYQTYGASPHNAIIYNGKIVFGAATDLGYEPWISDGTTTGTKMIKDVVPGPNNTYPGPFTEYNGKLFFIGNTAAQNGQEVYYTDGTATGTQLLMGSNPSLFTQTPCEMVVCNSKLFFIASNSADTTDMELWVTDGTKTGTHIVKDINPSKYTGSLINGLTVFNNKLYFSANDGVHGEELWVSDGTTTGTKMVIDLYAGQQGMGCYPIGVANNRLFFTGDSTALQHYLFSTDGTAAGTVNLGPIQPGGEIYHNRYYYTGYDAVNGWEPWISDGTIYGTTILKNIVPGVNGQYVQYHTYKNELYLSSSADTSYGIWRTDGTTTGTIKCLSCNKLILKQLTEYMGFYFYLDYNSFQNIVLMVTDTSFTIPPYEVQPPNDSFSGAYGITGGIREIMVYDSALYFNACTATKGCELWRLKGIPLPVNAQRLNKENDFVVYPNPNTGNFNIQFPHTLSGQMTMSDMTGRTIYSQSIHTSSITLSLQSAKGMYILKLQTADGITTKRITIE